MVWVCEFQNKNESAWAYVVGTRREAIAKGKQLEADHGFIRVFGTKEYDTIENDTYHIYKTDQYYFGA